jgi:hypothetical protein
MLKYHSRRFDFPGGKVLIVLPGAVLLSFASPKESNKEKAIFSNGSARKKSPTLLTQFAMERYGAGFLPIRNFF